MNNAIAYVAPKSKTIAHSMSLKNRISCVVGISIFSFNKYRRRVFNLMELNMKSTFKHFLRSETVNAEKNKSYYQQYNVKNNESLSQADIDETANI